MAGEKVYYRFENLSDVTASVYWVPTPTYRQLYCSLKPGDFVDVNTFLTHCWMFEDARTGDALVANNCCIFTPTKWRDHVLKMLKREHVSNYQCSRIQRKLLVIRRPQPTLTGLALNAIRDTDITIKQAEHLEIPRSLKEDLIHMLRKRECIKIHSDRCRTCPYDLHKAHFHHCCNLWACLSLLKRSDVGTGRWVRLPFGRVTSIPSEVDPPKNHLQIISIRAGNE